MIGEEAFRGASLCVVGNLNRDVRLLGVPRSARILEDGETSVAGVAETVGGGGANSACGAAALGARVRLVAKVGRDELAARLEAALRRRGVEPLLARDPHLPTGTSAALGFEDGRRHFLSLLPASGSLSPADLEPAALGGDPLAGCDHLLRADVWFAEAMLRGGNESLFRRAREAGLAVSLDLNWDPLWGAAPAAEVEARKEAVRRVLPLVDLVHGNERELAEFSGAGSLEEALRRIGEWGAREAVVHLGARGAGWWRGGRLEVEPAAPAGRIVQATGTGDLLSAACILLHRRDDLPLRERLRLANRVAAEYLQGRRDAPPAL